MTNLPVPVSTQDELPAILDRAGPAARFIDELAPAVSDQRLALAALRRFFDVLVTRHAALINPLQSVRGPRRGPTFEPSR